MNGQGAHRGARHWLAAVAVCALLVVAALVVDELARRSAEERVADAIISETADATAVTVTIEGFPFLTQLAAGTMEEVSISADSLRLTEDSEDGESVVLTDIEAVGTGVTLSSPLTVAQVEGSAIVTLDQVETIVREAGLEATVSAGDGSLLISQTVLGLELNAELVPVPLGSGEEGGPGITFRVEQVTLGGAEISLADLESRFGISVPTLTVAVEALPEGLEISGLSVSEDGLDVTIAGEDVTLE